MTVNDQLLVNPYVPHSSEELEASRRMAVRNHPSGQGVRKLRVLVSLEPEQKYARIPVKGRLTLHNLRALCTVINRTNTLMAQMRITIDLSRAQADTQALDELRTMARHGRLLAWADADNSKCQLQIIEPAEAL